MHSVIADSNSQACVITYSGAIGTFPRVAGLILLAGTLPASVLLTASGTGTIRTVDADMSIGSVVLSLVGHGNTASIISMTDETNTYTFVNSLTGAKMAHTTSQSNNASNTITVSSNNSESMQLGVVVFAAYPAEFTTGRLMLMGVG